MEVIYLLFLKVIYSYAFLESILAFICEEESGRGQDWRQNEEFKSWKFAPGNSEGWIELSLSLWQRYGRKINRFETWVGARINWVL